MMTAREVAAMVGVSRNTIYQWLKAGRFPEARRVNGRRAGWKPETIAAWIEENVGE